jgi:hypothetical protein
MACSVASQRARPGSDFSVEESGALLQAIFPNYPEITDMEPTPEMGEFLRALRAKKGIGNRPV